MRSLLFICLALWLAGSLARAEDKDLNVSQVYEEKGKLVVETKDGLHKVEMDQDLKNSGDYEIKLNKRSFQDGNQKVLRRQLSLDEQAELKKLQFEAQALYEKKDYGNAWAKVNAAQEIDPWSIELINMKGTLLFLTGSPELAIAYWKESLKINDNQPFLKTTIDRVAASMKEKAAAKPATASQGAKP